MNAYWTESHLLRQLQLCSRRRTPFQGKKFHAHIIKMGIEQSVPYFNDLLNMYGKCGLIEDANQLFDEISQRDLVSWASILTAHNQANLPHRTLSIFPNMLSLDGLQPDHFVFASLTKACASLGSLRIGKQVHARFVLSPFSDDDVVKSSLVDMYVKGGLPDDARLVFDSIGWRNSISWTAMISGYARNGRKSEAVELLRSMPEKNLFSWTALISGLVQCGHWIDAFKLFIEMRREGVYIADPFILSTVVGASANLAALELGKQIHCLVVALGYESSLFVSNGLVDMYAKCSDVMVAKNIFDTMCQRDVVSWTSIIVGMAQHGRAEDALSLYDEMILTGLKPNEVTFVGLIYACSHVGLVSKGRGLFKSMVDDYGLSPSLQHYTCVLDLFSRSGHLDEAENLLNTMPFKPDEASWAALLCACKRHGNTQMGIRIANHLLNIEPVEPSTYILLSNTYAGAAMWENVSKVRKLMASMEFRREPGYSCIDLGKESQVFCAGEIYHTMKDEIFGLLKELDVEMRKRGYVPDTSSVLHDMEEHEKEKQLFWHSERLAVAYGLLKAVPGTVLRIVKNLRVCGDCHTVLKFISSIVEREIIVRDASRFHHFKDGRCSCCDFW
ncbi:pentatricopeptide repeat-containing protein At4g14050, mitochondrial [Cornus florida]|uniref:pentatricopeptide repeat-containing protein At4g14050, mitochondrial n=1 Tax=Cornus florida TaxID=4283 RepID=UPI002896A2CD|nr:pentatricopeptide repeat-containing protein At4g14050, mitochondrial [Cornus florida]